MPSLTEAPPAKKARSKPPDLMASQQAQTADKSTPGAKAVDSTNSQDKTSQVANNAKEVINKHAVVWNGRLSCNGVAICRVEMMTTFPCLNVNLMSVITNFFPLFSSLFLSINSTQFLPHQFPTLKLVSLKLCHLILAFKLSIDCCHLVQKQDIIIIFPYNNTLQTVNTNSKVQAV